MSPRQLFAVVVLLSGFWRPALSHQTKSAGTTESSGPGPAADLTLLAEKSDFQTTGRYDEVVAVCHALARRHPGRARCAPFGLSPEGRPMLALVASADGKLDPRSARQAGRPVILVLGGIHAGEIDGKDAGFLTLRDLLAGRGPAAALRAVTVVFVPVFNLDGHERFGPNHRPNQRGPRESGFRTTAQNLNLNRDFIKAEAPEMMALLALMARWDPLMLVDLHVTDGAKFEHDVAVIVSPEEPLAHGLDEAAADLSGRLMADLRARGHLPLPFYPSFRSANDPSSGIDRAPSAPRYSHRYMAVRNRLGILVETHSWRPYPHRVRTTRAVLEALLGQAVAHAPAWAQAVQGADRAGARLAGSEVALTFRTEPPARPIEFRGYAFSRELSPISGASWIRYREDQPQVWQVPLHDRIVPRVSLRAPAGGYLVPAAFAELVGKKLTAHQIRFERIARDPGRLDSETFRAESVKFASSPFEGRFGVEVQGRWRPEPRTVGAGALYVPADQPRALLLMHLLEPTAPDSLVSWGFFHAAFEQKEYMEDYVAEEEARKMLAADPQLRASFEAEVGRDPALARDPRARLRYFYRRHPAWDERLNLYPILRLAARPAAP
jgi:hypothetical protein